MIRRIAAVALAVAGLVAGLAPGRAGAAPALPPVVPSFGITMPGVPQDLAPLTQLGRQVGARPGLVMWYEQWSWATDFPAAAATAVERAGAVPEITWEPWNPADGVDQPSYSLASIAGGQWDGYLRHWARQIKAWHGELRIRFAQEMNGDWYPWDEGVNGNRPGSYVAAWRHVHRVFAAAGVRNVQWVWCPNVEFPGTTPLRDLWPGRAYVDAVALDGYNWGPGAQTAWTPFRQIFAGSVTDVRALTSLPLAIGEVGSTPVGGNKPLWMLEMFATLATWPDVSGFTWFDFDKEQDWRIDSSPLCLAAFRLGLSRYAH